MKAFEDGSIYPGVNSIEAKGSQRIFTFDGLKALYLMSLSEIETTNISSLHPEIESDPCFAIIASFCIN